MKKYLFILFIYIIIIAFFGYCISLCAYMSGLWSIFVGMEVIYVVRVIMHIVKIIKALKKSLVIAILLMNCIYCLADDWMSRLNDGVYVWQVSIPGTHDAATGNGFSGISSVVANNTAKTQDLSIEEQWNAGIRCFDLRPTVKSKSLEIYHGIFQTKLSMSSALTQLCSLLDSHPSEFCIVIMRHEDDGDGGDSSWGTLMKDLLAKQEISSHLADFNGYLTVGQMRGKLLIISRNEYEGGVRGAYAKNWSHNSDFSYQTGGKLVDAWGNTTTLCVQDYYEVEDPDIKVTAVKKMIDHSISAFNSKSPIWVVNHCSGYNSALIPNVNDIRKNAETVHAAVLDYMAEKPQGSSMGIMMMDYAGVDKSGSYNVRSKELISVIIDSNFSGATAVNGINTERVNGKRYTVQGTPIENIPAGSIYIENGKKRIR